MYVQLPTALSCYVGPILRNLNNFNLTNYAMDTFKATLLFNLTSATENGNRQLRNYQEIDEDILLHSQLDPASELFIVYEW